MTCRSSRAIIYPCPPESHVSTERQAVSSLATAFSLSISYLTMAYQLPISAPACTIRRAVPMAVLRRS